MFVIKVYFVPIFSDSYRSFWTIVSDRSSVSIRLLIIQHGCCIGQQLERSTSKSDTLRSVPFQKQIIVHDFFDLKVYSVTLKSVKMLVLHSKWKQTGSERNTVFI